MSKDVDVAIKGALDVDEGAREITAFAINNFGTGEHPWADARGHNLSYFMTAYAIECLAKVVQSDKVTPEAVRLARGAIRLLGGETCINCGCLIEPEFDACETCV